MSVPLTKQRDYVTAVLLSFFLGPFGVDRFYLGYTGLGILKLVTLGVTAVLLSFFLGFRGGDRFDPGYTGLGISLGALGGCGVWSLIDFILIVVGKLKDADGNELKR